MAFNGVNCRATSGFIADGTGNTYSLGEAYPTTRGGFTFGWSSSVAANTRDRATSYGPHYAGLCFQPNSGGATVDFKVDLPSGAGAYNIKIVSGDYSSEQNSKLILKDGASVIATLNGATAAGQIMDATGAILTMNEHASAAALDAACGYITHTFAATQLTITVGGHASAYAVSALNSVQLEFTGGGGASTTFSVTSVSTFSGAASSGSSASFSVTSSSTFSGSASVTAAGVLTTPPLKNNTGTLLASETGIILNIYNSTTGVLVVQKTNVSTDASGVISVSDPLLLAGTTYAYEPVLTGARRRLPTLGAT